MILADLGLDSKFQQMNKPVAWASFIPPLEKKCPIRNSSSSYEEQIFTLNFYFKYLCKHKDI